MMGTTENANIEERTGKHLEKRVVACLKF